MFLHSGWVHVLGNMLYLWIFGDNVEDHFGHPRYPALLPGCGERGGRRAGAVNPIPRPDDRRERCDRRRDGRVLRPYPRSRVLTAIFVVFFLDLVEVPAIFFLGVWFLMQLFSGVGSIGARSVDGGVAFWAHVAGFASGALYGALRRFQIDARREYW